MITLVRRLRGALGIALTWGVLWAPIGLALGLILAALRPGDIDPGEGPGRIAAVFGVVGFLSGLGSAALLSLGEQRKTIRQLSPARVALWGALGAAAIPLLIGADASMALMTGSMGALFAAGSTVIARRAALRDAKPVDLLE